jgi:hypothetical protein
MPQSGVVMGEAAVLQHLDTPTYSKTTPLWGMPRRPNGFIVLVLPTRDESSRLG